MGEKSKRRTASGESIRANPRSAGEIFECGSEIMGENSKEMSES